MTATFDKGILRSLEFWASCVAFVATGLFVAPVARWIAQDALAKEQIQHPFLILCFAAFMLLQYHRLQLRPSLRLDNVSIALLGLCYGFAALAYFAQWPAVAILPLVLYLAALTRFLFGARHYRLAQPLLVAFAAFLLMAVYVPIFDWPLRVMAGRSVAWALDAGGFGAELAVQRAEDGIRLILSSGGQLFHVAPECNGYGTLSSALLVCIVTMLALKAGWRRLAVSLAFSLGLAFAFNVGRILAITQLAKPFEGRYYLMHEIVGNVALFACLYAVWRVCLALAGRGRIGAQA